MYFKITSDVDKFSYIIHKNPETKIYEKEYESFNIFAQFVNNEQTYEIMTIEKEIEFLNLAKEHNLDCYLNSEISSVCPNNLKSISETFRTVLRGYMTNEQENLSHEEFLKHSNHEAIIGPFINDLQFTIQLFENININAEEYVLPDSIPIYNCFFIKLNNNVECSVSEFLQKIYVISLFLSYNHKSIFKFDIGFIEKIINLSKNWMIADKNFNMIVNKFCRYDRKLKEKFIKTFKDTFLPDEEIDDSSDRISKKLTLHQKRHELIKNELTNIQFNSIVDLCSSEGKLLNELSAHYKNASILGIEKDFYKVKQFKPKTIKHRVIESNILYPNISQSDLLPDVLTCIEAIEHFEKEDRNQLLSLITDVFVPKYVFITTPNVEFNKFYNMDAGTYRRRDHKIEYTKEQFEEEVVKHFQNNNYNVKYLNLIESSDEFENMQPSFCIMCSHKECSLIQIQKAYPNQEHLPLDDYKYLINTVDSNEWPPERIAEWMMNDDYKKHKRNLYKRSPSFKKLKKIESMHGNIFLPCSGHEIKEKELNVGYTSNGFISNSHKIFHMGPTISPVEYINNVGIKEKMLKLLMGELKNIDTSIFGNPELYIEHPVSAFLYYRERGINNLIQQEKYMGSRASILWFKTIEDANKLGFNSTLTINSRGGFSFFETEDYLDAIHTEIGKNLDFDEKSEINMIALDAEILPWTFKAKDLIERSFRSPLESQYLANKIKNKSTKHIEDTLNTLDVFSKDSPLEIRPFHVLAFGDVNDLKNVIHGYHIDNQLMMRIIEIICNDCTILKPCSWKPIDVSNLDSMVGSVAEWLSNSGMHPKDTLENIEIKDNICEGFVYKPFLFTNYTNSGYLIQPALKVRGYKYLNLIYGLPLYENPDYFNIITQRRVNKKRIQAVQEFEMSKYIMDTFLYNKPETRIKYVAGFFGMEYRGSIDRTL